jgi:hypothetical protein
MANAAATGAGKLPKTAIVKFSTSLYSFLTKAFSLQFFWQNATVTFSLLFDN